MRTLVIGDIHGGFLALKQVLRRAKFDYKHDTLICLGDVADGWEETAEALDFLIEKVQNLIYIRGNHDQWLKDWLKKGKKPRMWTMQGGINTIDSYERHPEWKKKHLDFLKKTPFFYEDSENRLFVHGGIVNGMTAEEIPKHELMWSRMLWENRARYHKVQFYREIYVGHTSIYRFSAEPINHANVWFMDTGGGWEGVLSVMDIDTKKVWQSDKVSELYPNCVGRN